MACVYKVKHLIKDETEFGRVSTKAWHHISVPVSSQFDREFIRSKPKVSSVEAKVSIEE